MDSEKELLKQDLNKQESPEQIEQFIKDAELLEHKDIAELGRQKLQEVLSRAEKVGQTGDSQLSQVENMGGSNNEIENRTEDIDKKIEEVKIETQGKIEEVKGEDINETEKQTEEKIISLKNQEQIEQIKNSINGRKWDIEKYKENLDILSRRLENNKRARDDLKEYFDKLVKKASISSETGGNTWELVTETQKLRELELQKQAKMAELERGGKTWNQSQSDLAIQDFGKQIRALAKDGISQNYGYSSPGEGTIYFKGPSGEIGKEGVMTLKDALESSILYHKNIIEEYKNKISENEQEIKKLEDQIKIQK